MDCVVEAKKTKRRRGGRPWCERAKLEKGTLSTGFQAREQIIRDSMLVISWMRGLLENCGPKIHESDSPRPQCAGRSGNVGYERLLRLVPPLPRGWSTLADELTHRGRETESSWRSYEGRPAAVIIVSSRTPSRELGLLTRARRQAPSRGSGQS